MTVQRVRQLQTQVLIGGITLPVISWTCHLTSYGNLCTFEATTSIKGLRNEGYEIYQKQQANSTLECKIVLIDNTEGSSQVVFDGIVDQVEGIWEQDILEITGRDFSAILRDKTETLDQYVNQTVSQVVTGIAQANNLTPNVQATSQIAGVRVSTFQGENWAFSSSPKPTWHIIQQLADEVGYLAFVDQNKVLNFQAPGMGKSQHQFFWKPTNQYEITKAPILKLAVTQQSRRCSNFTLVLHGYDHDGKQTIFYKAKPRGDGSTIINRSRGDLNSQNYQQVAENLADEIERKNAVVKLLVDGDSTINVNDQLTIIETQTNDLLGFSGRPLFVVGVVQQFGMPDFGSSDGDGFLTHITCNQMTTAST